MDGGQRVPGREPLRPGLVVPPSYSGGGTGTLQPAPRSVGVPRAGEPDVAVAPFAPRARGSTDERPPCACSRSLISPLARGSSRPAVASNMTSRPTRSGRAAAARHAVTPPSETPITVGGSDPLRPSRARADRSALNGRRHIDGVRGPVPGLSYTATRPNRECSEELPWPRVLPEEVDVGDPARDEEHLGRPVTKDLPSDLDAVVLEVTGLWRIHLAGFYRITSTSGSGPRNGSRRRAPRVHQIWGRHVSAALSGDPAVPRDAQPRRRGNGGGAVHSIPLFSSAYRWRELSTQPVSHDR